MPSTPVALEHRVSDLVVESRIEATWDPATEQTTHIRTAVGVSARRRRLKTEETWKRKRILGRGAYGTVWLEERIASSGPAHGESTLRAIKEIRKRANVSAYEFHRELEAMAKFSHERFAHCFVRSLGWFESEESLFITMEYLKYGDLQQYLTRPFPEPEARQICLQIAEALQLMHESGFAHRDLKPGNILVLQRGPAWWVKVADFGISKRVEASTILRTMEIGTRGFMAPEILGLYCPDDVDDGDLDDDEPESDVLSYTPAIDLWALGEITHRMLTQKPVFAANKRLWSYVTKGTPFPANELESAGTSVQGIKFIQETMAASPKTRLTAEDAMNHEWLESHEFIDDGRSRSSMESARDIPPSGMTTFDNEPSKQWSITERSSEPMPNQSGELIPTIEPPGKAVESEEDHAAEPSTEPLTVSAAEGSPNRNFGVIPDQSAPSHRSSIHSLHSNVSQSSINNPKLLHTVEDTIKRLIHPEVNAIQANRVGVKPTDNSPPIQSPEFEPPSEEKLDGSLLGENNTESTGTENPHAVDGDQGPLSWTGNRFTEAKEVGETEEKDLQKDDQEVAMQTQNTFTQDVLNNFSKEQKSFIVESLEERDLGQPAVSSLQTSEPPQESDAVVRVGESTPPPVVQDRWAQIRMNAAARAVAHQQEDEPPQKSDTVFRVGVSTPPPIGREPRQQTSNLPQDEPEENLSPGVQDRWAQIRKNASERAIARQHEDLTQSVSVGPSPPPYSTWDTGADSSNQGRKPHSPSFDSPATSFGQILTDSMTDMTISPQGRQDPGTPTTHESPESTYRVNETSTTPKRDLKSWWKGFKSKPREYSATQTGIFGVPLRQGITYANVAINLTDERGSSYIYGYVPIVVAKCGVFLKERGVNVVGIFRQPGSAKRIKELITVFNSPDRYGKGLSWDGYTVHDAANVLRRYLVDLPEPVIPIDMYERFREPLWGAIDRVGVNYGALLEFAPHFDQPLAIRHYQGLITEMPPLNRQLLLYLLDLFAVFAAKADENQMNAQSLATIFQPGILSRSTDTDEHHLSQCVVIFLIENQDHFLIGMKGTGADA